MKCNNSCIYYQIYSGTTVFRDEPVIRIMCDYKEKLIKELSDQEREECSHCLTKNDIQQKWKDWNTNG